MEADKTKVFQPVREESQNSTISKGVLFCVLFMSISIAIVFFQVSRHEFVNYDDHYYVTDNPIVKRGLTLEGIRWALQSTYASNWHPVTWLSHMMDVQLFGVASGWHHIVNVILHLCNAMLLFFLFKWMKGSTFSGCLLASLFALHPLHVESVAWVAERKDVLSTLFWLLSMLAYAWYCQKRKLMPYALALTAFALGLMTKPMLVTLPFVFLLMDYWPMARYVNAKTNPSHKENWHKWVFPIVLEKIPFLILSAISCTITIHAQKASGAMALTNAYPILLRMKNAIVSYWLYIYKTLWPTKLAVLYPYDFGIPSGKVLFAMAAISAITVFSIRLRKSHPWLVVGWFWYLGTLLPVIGLVQVGTQAMADRYTYVPIIGLFIMVAWETDWQLSKLHFGNLVGSIVVVALILTCSLLSWKQAGYWKNSATLFHRAIDVTQNNYVAHNNLGQYLSSQGLFDEALIHYRKALAIAPRFEVAYLSMGNDQMNMGKFDEAMKFFDQGLQTNPNNPSLLNNMGNAHFKKGLYNKAAQYYARAIQADPRYAEAYNNLGGALVKRQRYDDAVILFQKALQLKPFYADAENNLANLQQFMHQGGHSDSGTIVEQQPKHLTAD
jgi:tetratricopeptide (TPR) repeat protein